MAVGALLLSAGTGAWIMAAGGDDGPRPAQAPTTPAARSPLGLFTSLPILWSEEADIAAMLEPRHAAHWARAFIEARHAIVPLDTLLAPGNARLLLMAQPRPLSPDENVALDEWVRGGGRLLLFADPALTQHSDFALGDRRRPLDTVLLSPILGRWGLLLRFDEDQPPGEREIAGTDFPVNLAGTLATASGGYRSRCRIMHGGLVASCAIGRGRALIVADAAVLDAEDPDGRRAAALGRFMDAAFAD